MEPEKQAIHGTRLTTSSEIKDLAAALAKAQGAFPSIKKERTVKTTSYSYSYADLSDILDAIRPHLAANGLSMIQPIVADGATELLVTRLLHLSGQWIESTYPLASYERPQETGSAITYARRYALAALLGIAAEDDDDGTAAQTATPKQSATRQKNPACPKCRKAEAVFDSKDKPGVFFCWKKRGGCGHEWGGDSQPADDPFAEYDGAPHSEAPEPSGVLSCAHCGSVNVKPDPKAPGWVICYEQSCRKGSKVK